MDLMTDAELAAQADRQEYPVIPAELREYADVVRWSIRNGDCELFRNSSPGHAAVLMQVFCEEASRYAYIFCGRLSSAVFGQMWPVFRAALGRGVDLRVITEHADAESKDVAAALLQRNALRTVDGSALQLPEGMPHFAVFDGRMSRIETDGERRTAIVRTSVADADEMGRDRMELMREKFNVMWGRVAPVGERR